eukprot:3031043-Rhodomonas_salina.2
MQVITARYRGRPRVIVAVRTSLPPPQTVPPATSTAPLQPFGLCQNGTWESRDPSTRSTLPGLRAASSFL